MTFEDPLLGRPATDIEIEFAFLTDWVEEEPFPTLRTRVGGFMYDMKLAAKEAVFFGKEKEDGNPGSNAYPDDVAFEEFDEVNLEEPDTLDADFARYMQEQRMSAKLAKLGEVALVSYVKAMHSIAILYGVAAPKNKDAK